MDEANIESHHYGNDPHNRLTNDPTWQAHAPRSRGADDRTRQEPPVDHLLVDGQRVGRRPQRRGRLPVREEARSLAAVPQRGLHVARRVERRHQLVHVPDTGGRRRRREEAAGDAAHPLRVHACDGQLERRLERVLGHLLCGRQRPGRLRLGLGRPGPLAASARRVPGARQARHDFSPTAGGSRTGSASATTTTSS